MDSVLAAFIGIFIMLFAALSLSNTLMSSQRSMLDASQQRQARVDSRSHTTLLLVSGQVANQGSDVELVYRNTGSTKLTDFDHWDLILEYPDTATPPGFHIGWLLGTTGVPMPNEWSMNGLFVNAAKQIPEVYEPGILNPGEEIKVSIKLVPPVAPGKTVQVVLGTENAVTAPTQVTRVAFPMMTNNTGLTVANSTTKTIDSTMLLATDLNSGPDLLTYTVITPPTNGTLSKGSPFTQADINNRLLTYTRSNVGNDSFTFTISNGDSSIGPFTFVLPPQNP